MMPSRQGNASRSVRPLWPLLGAGIVLGGAACLEGRTDGSFSADSGAGEGGIVDEGGLVDALPEGPACSASMCAAGVCYGGACRVPTVLASTPYEATRKIALTNDQVVFIDMQESAGGFHSRLVAVPKAGGAMTTIAAPAGTGIEVLGDFATDGASVFFSITNVGGLPVGVYRCGVTPCAEPASLASDGAAFSLSVQGDYVHWVDSPSGDVRRCAKVGCGGAPELVTAGPGGAGAGAGNLIATDAANAYVAYGSGLLGVVPLGSGQALTTLATHPAGFSSLALDAANVYVADADGRVMGCPKTGCPGGLVLIAVTASARSLTTEETTLFWLAGRGSVWSGGLGGRSPTELFVAPDGFERSPAPPRALAVDASSFYFGGQGVLRLAR